MGGELILTFYNLFAELRVKGAAKNRRNRLNLKRLRATIGTAIIIPFGMDSTLNAEEFFAGSFASGRFDAFNQTNRALIILILYLILFVFLHFISLLINYISFINIA